jgi:hypothetical protein
MLLESGDLIIGRKCVGLDVPNLIIFISKNGEKNPYKLQKKFMFLFIFWKIKKNHQVAKFRH